MLCQKTLLIAALLVLIGALEIKSEAIVVPKIGNDHFVGELTETSVLAHTERVTGSFFGLLTWHGLFNITRIEAFDQTDGTGFVSNIEDGLNSFRIRLIVSANYPYTEDVDFIVNIYGEPLDRFPSNDFVLGEETANSRLVHTERRTFTLGFGYFTWNGPFRIVKIEALDQNDGLGGFVTDYTGGVNSSGVYLYMRSVFETSLIDFIVNIYVENNPNNDVIQGNLTDTSVLMLTERVTGEYLSELNVNWRNTSFIVTRLEALDQTYGSGGEVYYVAGGVDFRYTDIQFVARFVGSTIDFIVNIYGEPVTTNDVIIGEITDTNIIIESQHITGNDYYMFMLRGPHDISRVEIIDQSDGIGGYVSQIIGGISYRFVYVYFGAMNTESSTIDFIVNVYAEPLSPNDFFAGELTSASVHIHHSRIVEVGTGRYNFVWFDPNYVITRVEAHDQSFGNGGEIYWYYGGVNATNLEIGFISVFDYTEIDFIIDIYGEPNFLANPLL